MSNYNARGLHAEPQAMKPPAKVKRPDVLMSAAWHKEGQAKFKENRYFTNAETRHGEIIRLLDQVEQVRQTPDPRMTPAAHAERVNKIVRQAKARIESLFNRAFDTSNDGQSEINQRITERLGLGETPYAGEIRATLRSMSNDERNETITRAIENGDSELISAAISGPALLSGMDGQRQKAIREQYTARHAADLLAEEKAITQSANALTQAGVEAMDFIDSMALSEDLEANTAADAALADFSESLTD